MVIRDRSLRPRMIRARAAGVIVGQVEQNELGQLEACVFVFLTCPRIGAELIQKLVGAKLVGIIGVESG